MMELYALANVPDYDDHTKKLIKHLGLQICKPTVILYKSDLRWHQCLLNWIRGEPPSDSPEWGRGVHAWYRERNLNG